jgi:histone H3/H4
VSEEVRYAVARIAHETSRRNSLQISSKLVDILVELAEGYASRVTVDLCAFARHAKRSTVAVEDVLLCTRHNETARDALRTFSSRDAALGLTVSADGRLKLTNLSPCRKRRIAAMLQACLPDRTLNELVQAHPATAAKSELMSAASVCARQSMMCVPCP